LALNAAQSQAARFIIGLAVSQGIPLARAREMAAAAYAESGLNPKAVNKSSGAAGYFQLLSPGYRTKAQQLGGLFDPRANTMAILPNYKSYWQQNPNAAPGAAARDIERSGMGAEFYSRPLSLVGGVAPGGGAGMGPGPQASGIQPAARPAPGFDPRQGILADLAAGKKVDFLSLLRQKQLYAQQQPPPAMTPAVETRTESPGAGHTKGALAEAFYDPIGQYDNGRFSSQGIGGHSDHVHLSITNPQAMISAINYAQQHGLAVRENPYVDPVDPVHVKGSFHYKNFPGMYGGKRLGEGIDVSGSAAAMAAYYRWATQSLR
jgi:hypothetical protein